MPEFLTLISPDRAREIFLSNLLEKAIPYEQVDSREALGRTLAKKIVAPHPLPPFTRSSVDGYAVRAEDTYGAGDSMPTYLLVVGEIPMGTKPGKNLSDQQCMLIHTGGMLPEGANAVVMLENAQHTRGDEIEVYRPVAPGENLIFEGEDIHPGEVVLEPGVVIRPAEIGGLMALGISQIKVAARPRIGIISSGDEVVRPENEPSPGQVRDVNTYTLSALVREQGAEPIQYGIIPDWKEALRETVKIALRDNDAVVITAGSSASSRDLTSEVIGEMGPPGVLIHGVNLRPGKPTILAVCSGKAVVGLPGNPVSAMVAARLFVLPLISKLLGRREEGKKPGITARLVTNMASQAGREDWIPVRLVKSKDGYLAEPTLSKSNLIFSLVRADGLVCIAEDDTGLEAGHTVTVYLL